MRYVRNINAILGVKVDEAYTWSNPAPRQTSVVVTYSFATGIRLDLFGDDFPASARYYGFNEIQRQNFRSALAEYEDKAGIVFVETTGRAMINVARATGTDSGGYSYLPLTSAYQSKVGFTELVIDGRGTFGKGAYEYQTMLHEIGHAVGLTHPHEDFYRLVRAIDDAAHTVMTYNVYDQVRNATKLGTLDVKAIRYLYGDSAEGIRARFVGDHVQITGTSRADKIIGASHKNVISGGDGNDRIYGREAADILKGGAGNDRLQGLLGSDKLYGFAGDDRLFGDIGRDSLYGGSGNDELRDRDDQTYLDGGSGHDLLVASDTSDTLLGGHGNDVLYGKSSDDTLFGGTGKDNLFGGAGQDRLYGGKGNDRLSDGSAGDLLYGGSGDDRIATTGNATRLYGGAGGDTLRATGISNELFGGSGGDRLIANGQNTLTGGEGADVFVLSTGPSGQALVIADFTTGDDRIDLSAYADLDLAFETLILAQSGDDDQDLLISFAPDQVRLLLHGISGNDITADMFDF